MTRIKRCLAAWLREAARRLDPQPSVIGAIHASSISETPGGLSFEFVVESEPTTGIGAGNDLDANGPHVP